SLCPRWLGRALSLERCALVSDFPVFLCPAVAQRPFSVANRRIAVNSPCTKLFPSKKRRALHTNAALPLSSLRSEDSSSTLLKSLPTQCYGCGALSQTSNPDVAGYFDTGRKAVQEYLGLKEEIKPLRKAGRTAEDILGTHDPQQLQSMGVDLDSLTGKPSRQAARGRLKKTDKPPLCDRCHHLVHHHSGKSIAHPTIEGLRDTIEETPFKYNHVYHILDAADFPMSLLPRINQLLNIMPLRTKNRRSRDGKFYQGRKIEMSFIITRSDLLAPLKQQVDALMPYLKEVLRDALGRAGRDIRLGNVRCVSARRSWWIKELKEDIWDRGGAAWLVGKVNVGKSQLFEAVFPKGRMGSLPSKHHITVQVAPEAAKLDTHPDQAPNSLLANAIADQDGEAPASLEPLDEFTLLPPPQKEMNYPEMPLVSSLPGTTASPIRIPFGNGKGELIDLPGLSRGDLELHVQKEYRKCLVMKSRVLPEQQVLKPGQSLLLGGFIRITPRTPDLIFLAYNFTPIEHHTTATAKAVAIQEQAEEGPNVINISLPGTGAKVKHAGTFALQHDVTQERAGPITRRDAVSIRVNRLPYRVLSLDLLIEGCGWVEITAQVRTKDLFAPKASHKDQDSELLETLDLSQALWEPKGSQDADPSEPNWPLVDVFSPEGRFVGSRKPMNGWLLNKPKSQVLKQRPRKSMKGAKKSSKLARRSFEAASA
ncbi:hypothetical protein GQ53DRAFT_611643, partial [Thozetella sp. PMI_491]